MASIGDNRALTGKEKERRLLIDCVAELPNGHEVKFQALVDTGAEINVISPHINRLDCTELLQRPWNLTAANQQPIRGGNREARVDIRLHGVHVDTGRPQDLKIPTTFLLADVTPLQAIVSYEWVSQHNFLVNPRRHGICYQGDKTSDLIWIPGVRSAQGTSAISAVRTAPPTKCSKPLQNASTGQPDGILLKKKVD